MTEPTAEEIARVEAWQAERDAEAKCKKEADAQRQRREREERIQGVRKRLAAAFVGKTVERIETDSEYEYEGTYVVNYEAYEFKIVFTDGSSVEFEGQYDSRSIDIDVKAVPDEYMRGS